MSDPLCGRTCDPRWHCRLCGRVGTEGDGTRPTLPEPEELVPVARPDKCLHLGVRMEFRAGCGGWTCRHVCDAGEPVAVPGGVCQTCPQYEADA